MKSERERLNQKFIVGGNTNKNSFIVSQVYGLLYSYWKGVENEREITRQTMAKKWGGIEKEFSSLSLFFSSREIRNFFLRR